jgi:hypothetical protein
MGMLTTSGTRQRSRSYHRLVQVLALMGWLVGLLVPGVARADAPETSYTYTFGQAATFSVTFPQGREINEATLYLQTSGNRTEGFVAPIKNGRAALTRNLAQEPLPPFAHITYWWTYTASDGILAETEKQAFDYLDNRYSWQTAEASGILVHWVTGERRLMIQSLDVAQAALAQFQDALQSPPAQTTDIYIYPSQPDLASAMQLASFDWVGGVTYPELGVILVAIPPTDGAITEMQQEIPHELVHKALYDMLGARGYASLPTWLNEGLATYFEEHPDPTRAVILQQAHRAGTLIPVSELCLPLPEDPERAQLAYAQSESLVSYLRQSSGWSSLRSLISVYADGKACATGIQEVLGVELIPMERAWRIWLEQDEQPADEPTASAEASLFWRDTGPWLALMGILLLPGLAFFIAGRR